MILCDREIESAHDDHRLFIDPRPALDFMDSTTVDLRLGDTLDQWQFPKPDSHIGQTALRFCPAAKGFKCSGLEAKYLQTINIESGFNLSNLPPENFILGWTKERIYLPHKSRLCARVEGKSSMARLGLGVHVTAPTIHSGFGHNKTNPADHGACLRLEIWNVGPLTIELMAGMRICQLIVEEVREVPKTGYQGDFNLQGKGPRPTISES
jgi:dCTP deaminase